MRRLILGVKLTTSFADKTTIAVLLHDIGKIIQRSMGKAYEDHSTIGEEFLKDVLNGLENIDEELYEIITNVVGKHHAKVFIGKVNIDNALSIAKIADHISAIERLIARGGVRRYILIPLFSIFTEITNIKNGLGQPTRYFYDKIELLEVTPFKVTFPFPVRKESDVVFNGKIMGEVSRLSTLSYQKIVNFLKNRLKKMVASNVFREDVLLLVLERACSLVPSDTAFEPDRNIFPDISLFDHMRVASLIARSLLNYIIEELNIDPSKVDIRKLVEELHKNPKKKSLLLIKGDISGVQSFIYSVGTKWALKLLRARSFYLELLAEDIITEILTRLNLGRSNVVYSGGGHFLIVAQNSKKAVNELKTILKNLNEKLYSMFKGALALSLAWEAVSLKDFEPSSEGECPRIIDILEDILVGKIEVQKYRKFAELLASTDTIIPESHRRCFSCKNIFPPQELRTLEECVRERHPEAELSPIEREREICEFCCRLISIGEVLVRSAFFVRIPRDVARKLIESDELKRSGIRYIELPFSYFLFMDIDPVAFKNEKIYLTLLADYVEEIMKILYKFGIKRAHLYLKNLLDVPEELLNKKGLLKNLEVVFFPVGDYVVYKAREGRGYEVKSIDDIVKRALGAEWAAALRLDVDSLSLVFIRGLKGEVCRYTFSRYATLSRFLNYFFKIIVPYAFKKGLKEFENYLIKHGYAIASGFRLKSNGLVTGIGLREEKEGNYELVIVYSGGDDVFLVGAWNHVISAAFVIDSLFRCFVANNPHLTLSAGIVLFDPKYPVLRASIMAGKMEEISKEYTEDSMKKDALTVFNQTFRWSKFRKIYTEMLKLGVLESEDAEVKLAFFSRSFLMRIINILQLMLDKLKEETRIVPIEEIYTALYHIGRYASTITNNKMRENFENFGRLLRDILYDFNKLDVHLPVLISIFTLFDLLTRQK